MFRTFTEYCSMSQKRHEASSLGMITPPSPPYHTYPISRALSLSMFVKFETQVEDKGCIVRKE